MSAGGGDISRVTIAAWAIHTRHDSLGFPLSVTLKFRGSCAPSLNKLGGNFFQKRKNKNPKREEETDRRNKSAQPFGKIRRKQLTLSRWRKEGWNSRDDEDPGATTWFGFVLFPFFFRLRSVGRSGFFFSWKNGDTEMFEESCKRNGAV